MLCRFLWIHDEIERIRAAAPAERVARAERAAGPKRG
jgi:hypothetical protein